MIALTVDAEIILRAGATSIKSRTNRTDAIERFRASDGMHKSAQFEK